MSCVGRLSTQKYPRSSSARMACDLPAPDRPVTTMKRPRGAVRRRRRRGRHASRLRVAGVVARRCVGQPLGRARAPGDSRAALSSSLRAATSTSVAMLRPGATGIRTSGTRTSSSSWRVVVEPQPLVLARRRPSARAARPARSCFGVQRRRHAVERLHVDQADAAHLHEDSAPSPVRGRRGTDSARRRTSTTSSATSRCPRAIRSSAHSLLPMPLSPRISTPRPEQIHQRAVDGRPLGEMVLEPRGDLRDGGARRRGRQQQRHPRRVAGGHQFGGRPQACRGQDARDVVLEQPGASARALVGRAALEEPHFAFAEYQHAARRGCIRESRPGPGRSSGRAGCEPADPGPRRPARISTLKSGRSGRGSSRVPTATSRGSDMDVRPRVSGPIRPGRTRRPAGAAGR